MDILALLAGGLARVWYFVPLIMILCVFKSPWFKGLAGEFVINRLLSQLPSSDYTLVKDVTLPTESGTTQIDHLVISVYGLFVVETKNMKGWIFGSKTQKQWTQKIYRHSTRFQNPLHQNYKHTKTLESLLAIAPNTLHSVVVFIGDSKFKTVMPDNVTYARGCVTYIKQFTQPVFSIAECHDIIASINELKLKKGVVTNFNHRRHVKDLLANKANAKTCSRCGSAMVIRKTKRGANKGAQFWGCSTFPKCRSVEALSESDA
ncbi:NERD domain-containing protein [Pseudoalteromonas sp. MM17-2]|uniref:nuclease-related domain-containing protein n=1 Tax=Pseudoalteromonas sp. MM17-2 TaxID=2917753 RepID=UPI001EF551F9|nr:NERD domain-containing protein [Pseudoalteromonas sp. MM17-2]